jgi:hypothetical protein
VAGTDDGVGDVPTGVRPVAMMLVVSHRRCCYT